MWKAVSQGVTRRSPSIVSVGRRSVKGSNCGLLEQTSFSAGKRSVKGSYRGLLASLFYYFSVGGGQSRGQTAVSQHIWSRGAFCLVLVYYFQCRGAVSQGVKPRSVCIFSVGWRSVIGYAAFPILPVYSIFGCKVAAQRNHRKTPRFGPNRHIRLEPSHPTRTVTSYAVLPVVMCPSRCWSNCAVTPCMLSADVGSSIIAEKIVSLCRGYARSLTVELGICLEGRWADHDRVSY